MNIQEKIINKVKRTISKYSMIRHGDLVIAAVSGGPDSVCLLLMLYELKDEIGMELIVAQFNHGLRPGEDDAETRFVRSLANALQLRFETKKAGPGILQGGTSPEERARHARYLFLEEVKEKFSAHKIAMGHNLNDQAETVIMRMLRGSGASGLSGIPPFRDEKIIRPLIELTRKEINAFLSEKGAVYMTDSSNLETICLRNRIRLELMPLLMKYQPRIVELLGQTARIMRRDNEWMEEEAERWVETETETGADGKIKIPLSLFLELPEALKGRVIRYVIRVTGGHLRRISMRHIEAVKRMAHSEKPQTSINLPGGLIAERVYNQLIFQPKGERKQESFCYHLGGPGVFRLEIPNRTISLKETVSVKPVDMENSPRTAYFDAEKISFPLTIRNYRQGDRFIPLGMKGHRKLKDFFIDLKIPSEERRSVPILICRGDPVWVCGYRIDDRFKIGPDTEKVLKVHLSGPQHLFETIKEILSNAGASNLID